MTRFHTPFVSVYHPENDNSRYIYSEGTRYYQELIGVLLWGIEVFRVDMLLGVDLLSYHLALTQTGHLYQVYHIFGYLKASPHRRLFFDPVYPTILEDRFHEFYWVGIYKDAKEDVPIGEPVTQGREFGIHFLF